MNRAVWQADFDKVSDAMFDYTAEGFVLDTRPPDLKHAYVGLLQIGYANGFLE